MPATDEGVEIQIKTEEEITTSVLTLLSSHQLSILKLIVEQPKLEDAILHLAMIFLTPVHRLALIYSRAFSSLLESVWLFFIFVVMTLFFVKGIEVSGWWSAPFAFLILLISAVIWGGFLNSIFFFSRDAGFLYTILDEPMLIFAGVRIPPLAFPLWAKVISFSFPLTYTLHILRQLLMEGATFVEILPSLAILFSVLLLLILISAFIIKKAEKHMKKTGNMVLF